MKAPLVLKIVTLILLVIWFLPQANAQLSGTLHLDNEFEVYLSTDDSVQGVLLTSGTDWPTAYSFTTSLNPTQDYFLHIRGVDVGGVAAFLGEFEISGSEHTFANGLNTLNTNTSDWLVSTSGWSNYQAVSFYGVNGVSPWGNRPTVDANAVWIWSADNDADNLNFFTTQILATRDRPPIVNYRFDEDEYVDVANEVIDSIGGFNGRASPMTLVPGKVCNAADLSPVGITDFVTLDRDILNGKSDFTVSLWAKTAKTGQQSFLSGARAGNANELIMWFPGATQFQPYLQNSFNPTIAVDSIASDTWHHLVWTREGAQNCLYKDTVLQGCVTRNTGILDIESLIMGQEQDNVGGAFVDSQAVDGLIDELLVFDQAVSLETITNIYNNQNEGFYYDGSVPSCPVESIPAPIVEYRFDECFYSEAPEEVLDQSGNFSAQTNGVPAPSEIAIVNKSIDLSASNTLDWVSVPSGTVDGLDDFSLSVWFKTAITKPQQEIFHALGSDASDDELEIYLQGGNTVVVKVKNIEHVLNSSVALSDDAWHHLMLTRVDEDLCLFIDGQQQDCDDSVTTGPLSVDNANSIVIGQEQDQIGGGFSAAQSFEGQLDEFKIFDVKLSGRQILSIYQNESVGDNFDGSARDTVRCPLSCGVAGTLNAVGVIIGSGGTDVRLDTTTEALNIYAAWIAAGSPASGLISAGTYNVAASGTNLVDRIDFGGSNRAYTGTLPYPGFGAVNDQASAQFLVQTSGTVNLAAGDYTIFIDSDDGFNFVLDTVSGDAVIFNKFGGSSAGASNELRFELPTGSASTGGSFTLSQDSVFDLSAIFFERDGGDYMEVAIVDGITSSTNAGNYEIFRDGALNGKVTFGCPGVSQINHYQIIHDGQGLTCSAETVTINACTNAYDGTCTQTTQAVTLDLNATGSTTFTDTISFVGSGTLDIPYTIAETVALSISNPSLNSANPVVCFDGSAINCNIIFTDAGFRFLDGSSGLSKTISNQIAGTSFPIRLQAVQNNNGVCEGIFTGDQDIELSQENVNPGGISGLSFSVDGTDIAKHTGATSITLNFGSDSIAPIPSAIYFDAGQIRLRANYDVGGISLTGSSNSFWVSPAELEISASVGGAALNAASATATPTHEAGEDFNFSVRALNSLGNVTPNYTPGQIQLQLARIGPTLSGSVDGNFSYAAGLNVASNIIPSFTDVTLTSFVGGVSSFAAAQYSEVGLLNLDAQDRDYGNESIVVPASAINIGRFTPHHFTQTVAQDGLFQARCDTRSAFTAYSGQRDQATGTIGAISYLSNPVLAITAYNKQGVITQNYFEDSQGSANDFMKLSNTSVGITLPTFDQVAVGVDASLLPLTASMSAGTLSQNDLTALPSIVTLPRGVVHYQLSSSDHFFYNRSANALVSPFRSDIDFSVTAITDTDNVNVLSTTAASPTGVEIRFGRLVLENSFGPETSNFPQPMRLEHFDGGSFTDSLANSCESFDASRISLSNISLDPALTAVLGSTGNFIDGKTEAIGFQATGAGNQGQISVAYDSFDWLKYDWDDDGDYDDNPTAVATFGLFRGDDRLIHWREAF
jgi:MSHA biogenesis protein MshQ